MRNWIHLVSFVSFVVLAAGLGASACQSGNASDTSESPEIRQDSQQILDGQTEISFKFDDACVMFVTLPPDDDDNPQDPIFCTCTLVGKDDGGAGTAATILTAGHCVAENLEANTLANIDVRFGPSFQGAPSDGTSRFGVTSVELQRYFNPDLGNRHDLALVRLDGMPGPQYPVTRLRSTPLGADDFGRDVFIVGYGEVLEGNMMFGARKFQTVPLRVIDKLHVFAGTAELTSCLGDSGGPAYINVGTELAPVFEQIGVTSRHFTRCFDNQERLRVDVYGPEFIFPFIDRFDGPCPTDGTCTETGCRSPDPDCDDCTWGNTCKEDCPTRDFDCPIGKFLGEDCELSGECEEGGRCVAAHDDATRTYCSRPCDVTQENECPVGMLCSDAGGPAECVFDPAAPAPGAQGSDCTSAGQCRSGICEEDICVDECDPTDTGSCDSDFGTFTCGPSQEADGKNVCLGQVRSGGGGFCSPDRPCCAIVPPGSGIGTRLGSFLLFGLALLGALRFRRSRRSL